MHGHLSHFSCRRCAQLTTGAATGSATTQALAAPRPFALPGSKTQWSRDRLFDVAHMKLEVTVDPAKKRIQGRVTHTIVPFLDALANVELDCCELTVTKVTIARKACRFALNDGKLSIEVPTPAKTAKKGKPLDVTIEYHGTPRRGIYFTGPDGHRTQRQVMVWTQGQDEDTRFWIPCFDFPNEKQTTEIVATVPAGMKALSNGRMLGHRKDAKGGTETWHWKLEQPHVIYLVTLVVGDFEVFETKWRGVPVTYWSPRGRMADVKRTLERTPAMLAHFSKRTGFDYAFPQYAQVFVQDFIFGGMENTSATTLMDTAILDADADREVWMDSLVAHELGHQWFGDVVTCRDWSQGWLNEGFATFMETVWKREADGRDEESYYRLGEAESYFGEDSSKYRRAIVSRTWNDPIEVFDSHLYQKGALVLHMLAEELGEDLFWESIRHYLERHKWGSVVTDDLRRAIEDVTGRNLEWFFDQWVMKGGHPELDVSFEENKHGCLVSVKQTQKTDELTPLFRFGLDLRIETEKGAVTRRVQVTEAAHVFTIDVPGKVKWIAVDAGAHLLHSGKVSQSDEQWAACLASDPDLVTRVRAARALGEKATPAAVKALAKALSSQKCWFVRYEAARALGAVRSEAARDALLAHKKDEDPRARSAIAGALGSFRHDERAAGALVEMLHDGERSPSTLYEAGIALGKTRLSTAFDKLVATLSRPAWNDMARRGAALGLGQLGRDDAIPVLVGELAPDRPDVLRAAAASALGKLGKDELKDREMIRDRLVDLVRDGHLRVQMTAIAALAERMDPKAIGALLEQASRDLDGRVKRSARIAATTISTGLDRGDELRKLRAEVEKMRDENRKILDRMEKLEGRK